jgi:hypothetical protein
VVSRFQVTKSLFQLHGHLGFWDGPSLELPSIPCGIRLPRINMSKRTAAADDNDALGHVLFNYTSKHTKINLLTIEKSLPTFD